MVTVDGLLCILTTGHEVYRLNTGSGTWTLIHYPARWIGGDASNTLIAVNANDRRTYRFNGINWVVIG